MADDRLDAPGIQAGFHRAFHHHAHRLLAPERHQHALPHSNRYAICQRNEEKLNAVGDYFGVDVRYTDYAALLKDKNVDVVHINSPIPDHGWMSIAGLKAGNPKRIIALNRGVDPQVMSYTPHEDFTSGEQNRFLLTDKDTGELTPRGHKIIEHTPMGRFGVPEDLLGTVLWLIGFMNTVNLVDGLDGLAAGICAIDSV